MTVLSVLRKSVLSGSFGLSKVAKPNLNVNGIIQLRNHGAKKMNITPTRWPFHKFKDMLHFYVMLGVFPLVALVTYVNVFIGPAQLAEIPEGYEPEKWEYYKHPIQRWLAKHVYPSHQEEYEKFLHLVYEEDEKMQMRRIQNKVTALMAKRGDSTAAYYAGPVMDHIWQIRKEKEDEREFMSDFRGLN